MSIKTIILLILMGVNSFSLFAEESHLVMVVAEKGNKDLPKDVDPILASTVSGLEAVQKETQTTGIIDCNCKEKPYSYISMTMGNGFGSEGGSMQWRAFTVRLGKSIDENTRIDFIHINEGHPTNNHRDGFALAGTYDIPVSSKLKIELSAGPYFSMNTTTKNDKEEDEKRIGLLGTIAALYSLDNISPGLHLRAEYNHVFMPGGITTDSFMVGVGKVFDASKDTEKSVSDNMEVSVIGDHFKTNHGGTNAAEGYQLEVKQGFTDHTAISFSYMHEGKDQLVDREGAATQLWYVQPLPHNMSVSVGAGPYFAKNKLADQDGNLNALISVEVKKDIGKHTSIFIRANRISDFSGSNDRDLIGLGVAAKF